MAQAPQPSRRFLWTGRAAIAALLAAALTVAVWGRWWEGKPTGAERVLRIVHWDGPGADCGDGRTMHPQWIVAPAARGLAVEALVLFCDTGPGIDYYRFVSAAAARRAAVPAAAWHARRERKMADDATRRYCVAGRELVIDAGDARSEVARVCRKLGGRLATVTP